MANQEEPNNKSAANFNISAAVVRQLGEELVSDEVTAIMELIKNSYDADADWVYIEINTKDRLTDEYNFKGEKGYIIIEDNGFGMNETEIKNGWLVISLSSKRKMKEKGLTTPKGRTPLGDKGLGRLSTQRLGRKLEMFSTKSEEKKRHRLAFSWDDFNEDSKLTAVPLKFSTTESNEKGTKLVISGLKDIHNWEGNSKYKFVGQLSQLIFPFKEQRPFDVLISFNDEEIDLDEINEDLRKAAQSSYEFSFDEETLQIKGEIRFDKLRGAEKEEELYQRILLSDNGKDFFDYLTDVKANKRFFLSKVKYSNNNEGFIEIDEKFEFAKLDQLSFVESVATKKIEIANPGPFYGEIDDYDLRMSSTIESTFDSLSEYKNIVKNQRGIRIFRDGFGIKPYGIEDKDWMKLSEGQTSGGSFYGLRPGNVLGFITLTGEKNSKLKEKTDREGFIDDPYSRNFFLLIEIVKNRINDILTKLRRSYNDYKNIKITESGDISSFTSSYERMHKTADKAKKVEKKVHTVRAELKNTSDEFNLIVDQQIVKKDELTPIERESLEKLERVKMLLSDTETLLTDVEGIIKLGKNLENDANYLQPRIEQLEEQLNEFSELAALGLTSESLSHEIANIVDRLVESTRRIKTRASNNKSLPLSDVFIYLENVNSIINALRKQVSHLAPSLKYVRETKESISIQEFSASLQDFYTDRFGKNEIRLEVEIRGQDYSIQINKGRLTQIFDNILLNAEYWLKERKKKEADFKPTITIRIDEPFVQILDNGFGIDPNYDLRVFQPFVTAKPNKEGRGLGLFIVQQLLESSGCDIMLLNKKNEFDRKYIFQLNFSAIKQ